jgi:hypothetical protein
MIPNVIHFVLISETEFKQDFLYIFYLSILSAKLVNNPDKIYFYYNFTPKGVYWDLIKDSLILEQVELPTHIGKKPLIKMAHKADIIRMNKLIERGGVYFDIDTISYRSYKHLLENSCVLGIQDHGEICNAILMTEPNHSFFKQWMDVYEIHFQPYGWAEASILLPWKLYHSNGNNQIVKLMSKQTFFDPGWRSPQKIFQENVDISPELITLHVWNTQSQHFIKHINDKSWFEKNPDTLYTKIFRSLNI